ncbi:FUN14 family-domain-containing protein [Filobasidium floriforme]|uniref:FUN14 family-domain-containing protein n=1 Tax=Filobasidium floriforme TaxID=5210 RepID=UPI001E8CD18F|nr:FUN14 family-domain-containing protein [Filobasidium floriforme]KAH8082296.1 FUN14 family-domain-containing protein [Filobasidium floriforme]
MNPLRPTLGLASSLKTLRFPTRQFGQLKPYHTTQFARSTPIASWSRRLTAVGLGSAAGLSLFALSPGSSKFSPIRVAECESYPIRAQPSSDDLPSQSILSPYQLSFGAICGICAGIFVKKGAKLVAFTFGALYVLMQYASSRSIINVNWNKLGSRYEALFGSKTAEGKVAAPTIDGVYRWMVDFLTANFQQRASFIAGFALGIRLG